ncbi:ABC transporter ATP-binding protein [Coprothermobacter platensis]|uniref:ATP-binding cassette domain-containing protein n=1 Tax=Coprothermobacter platensis TaxID=108819 RepID=UPI00036FB6ED|nr:ABC transporter ATP-binding protein [Coprothermobacter platensis]
MIILPEINFSYGSEFSLNLPHTVIDKFPTFLVGPNGSGKTTLLKIIGGFIKTARSPKVMWKDHLLDTKPTFFAYLPARPIFDVNFTVRDYLLLAGDADHLQKAVEELNLENWLNKKMGSLSSGWLQRVFIARILMQDTPYILMDEPTSFLDPEARKELIDILSKFPEKRMIVSSHDLSFLSSLGKFVMGLRDGQLVYTGEPKEFFNSGIEDVFVKGYII